MKTIVTSAFCLLVAAALTSCGGGSGSASGTDSSSAPKDTASAASVTANWKLGVQTWTFNHYMAHLNLSQALDRIDSTGIKSIECYWGQPLGGTMKGSFGSDMDSASRAQLKQLLQTKGIQIVAMGVIEPTNYDDWVKKQNVKSPNFKALNLKHAREEWTKAFELAKYFGLSYITAEPVKTQWDVVDSLAGAYGIKVAIHDHPKPNVYWSPDSVLAATVGHPNIGSCADVGHWARNGLNPVDCLKKLEGHIFGVHLKDVTKFGDTQSPDTLVGKGVVDFPAVFAELKRQNFSGMLSIEHESNWGSTADVIATKNYFDAQIAQLK